MKKTTTIFAISLFSYVSTQAQTGTFDTGSRQEYKKSTEIGLGVDFQFLSRINFQNYASSAEGDRYKLKLRDMMFGGNIYLARELNPWFYIDLQGTLGAVKTFDENDIGKEKNKMFAMVGPGIQFRLTPLFKRKYVEPYFRVGVNYYHKDFYIIRQNQLENFEGNFLEWQHSDQFNKNTDTKKNFFPMTFGFGVNSWFNDRVGFGVQGKYLTTFSSKRLNFPHATARIMLRFGSSKASTRSVDPGAPEIRYVEKIVTKEVPVEIVKEVIVEKLVGTEGDPLFLLFSNINFDFDKSTITQESNKVLDDATVILKKMPNYKFLITGFTDSRGAVDYNQTLSQDRAAAVKSALIARGVSASMLKSRGVGKNAASLPPTETATAREGDRKVTIEYIKNMEYWNKLP
ncbi:OmpA family protein [Sphingobacterium psychroaquaticum]|uniref:OmpA family protein n=1 Tax=Sphingobacterium psychroaquaticum TaxID=561061 RepID=UPI00106B5E24|nr:OmpA family protein [Sphingobacterium psychroaquaticum]QBQ40587.1 OmpA family protein [Sphingobacterium psychroaquaticum]